MNEDHGWNRLQEARFQNLNDNYTIDTYHTEGSTIVFVTSDGSEGKIPPDGTVNWKHIEPRRSRA